LYISDPFSVGLFSLVLIYSLLCLPFYVCFERLIRLLKPNRNVAFSFRERGREREIQLSTNRLLWQVVYKFPDNEKKSTVMLIRLNIRERWDFVEINWSFHRSPDILEKMTERNRQNCHIAPACLRF
jgi:hypothetical protein